MQESKTTTQPKGTTFNWRKRSLEGLIGLAIILVLWVISVPNLLRSRHSASQSAAVANLRSALEKAESEANPVTPHTGPMVVINAAMSLLSDDPAKSGHEAEAVSRRLGGYVGSMERYGTDASDARVIVVLRIPEARFEEARELLRKVGSSVTDEKVEAQDVSARYVDVDAQLRNFRTEEHQYLAVMRRTGPVKDTLEVARQLADVRGRIERLEGEMRLLKHQVQFATLAVSIRGQAVVKAEEWTPWRNARQALVDAGRNLASYADVMVVLLVNIPLVILWPLTVIMIGGYGWRLGAFMWKRWLAGVFTRQPASA